MTAKEALKHPWLASLPSMTGRNGIVHESTDASHEKAQASNSNMVLPATNQPEPGATNLGPRLMKGRKRFRKVVDVVLFATRVSV